MFLTLSRHVDLTSLLEQRRNWLLRRLPRFDELKFHIEGRFLQFLLLVVEELEDAIHLEHCIILVCPQACFAHRNPLAVFTKLFSWNSDMKQWDQSITGVYLCYFVGVKWISLSTNTLLCSYVLHSLLLMVLVGCHEWEGAWLQGVWLRGVWLPSKEFCQLWTRFMTFMSLYLADMCT